MGKDLEHLKMICNKKAYEIYGPDYFDKVADRLCYELEHISNINGGVRTVMDVADYLERARNLYRSVYGRELVYTFRGPVLSGIVPYLTGITTCDPISHGFYAWAFFIKKSKLQFNVNMSTAACKLLSEYDMFLPGNLILYSDSDLDMLEEHLDRKNISNFSLTDNSHRYDEAVRKFFLIYRESGDYGMLGSLNNFDERYVHDIREMAEYLRSADKLPKNLKDLVKLSGFIHSKRKNDDHLQVLQTLSRSSENIYQELISCPEDIYEKLVSNSCDIAAAEKISKAAQCETRSLSLNDSILIADFCGDDLRQQVEGIEHLFYRSQIHEKSLLTAALME